MLAGKIDLVFGQRLHDDGKGLDIHRLRLLVIDAEIVELVRRGAAADADLDATAAEVIQHADFLGEPQRVVRRQHVDQRAETDAARALGDGGQEHARRRRQVERRRVMLAHVIRAKAGAVVEPDQLEPLLVLLREGIRAAVVLIEDAELHRLVPTPPLAPPAGRSRPRCARIRRGSARHWLP